MKLSIVIPYHNEGVEFITTTLNGIKDTIDIDDYEMIIVDDYSDVPLELSFPKTKILRHNANLGVGAAFDTGVKLAQSDNLFLMGSDIRFLKNKWATMMLEEIKQHPKAFTCTSCVNINKDNPDIEKRKSVGVPTGATILMFHDKKSNPRATETFRGIIEAQWLKYIPNRDIDSYEIPCILGAAYGVSREWYYYVDGWAGHRKWGTLEPYISLKSWFFGGSCRCASRIYVGHLFKKTGTHGTPQDILMYNKMFVVTVLFDDYNRIIDFLGSNAIVERGRKMYKDNMSWILAKKAEYKKKIVIDVKDFFNKWNIDMRYES
ncbi:MAG: glycosyltransferase [Thiomicrorhabdus sp.]|jgi:glycosyltransferase involved in cell wall biosynthesis|nr:glycosyltransferase [Thiomicrorhabdus sp.]